MNANYNQDKRVHESIQVLTVCNGVRPKRRQRGSNVKQVWGRWEGLPQAKRSTGTMPRWPEDGTFLQVKIGECG